MGVPDSLDALAALLALLPGFLTAQILSTFVAREERTPFERVIQALLFTLLSHVLWLPIQRLTGIGEAYNLLGLSFCAVLWGVVLTWVINVGTVHNLFRRWGLTRAIARPSEWYDAFYDKSEHVILHLYDGRRIFGWPRLYPFRSDKGHILLEGAEWLDRPSGGHATARIDVDFLIGVADVRFVEFIAPKPTEKEHAESRPT